MSSAKKWEDLRGCERIVAGLRKNLHFVATAVFVIALCAGAAAADARWPALGLPLRAAFLALVDFGAWSLWTAALSLSDASADRAGGGSGGSASARIAGSGGEEEAARSASPTTLARATEKQRLKDEELVALFAAPAPAPPTPSTPGRGGKGGKRA